jgi:hypothetical protein
MPLKKILFRPGVNRENTRYAAETLGSIDTGTAVVAGWYESDKVRFRQGTPEKIGGWTRFSAQTFLGVCRSLWGWATLNNDIFLSLGTNLKFYLSRGGFYYDITPFRSEVTLNGPFTATASSPIINVQDVGHGGITGDYVNFADAVGLGGNITAAVLNQSAATDFIGFEMTVVDADNFTIDVSQVSPGLVANASDIGNGGSAVSAKYQLNIGPEIQLPITGWGAGSWGEGGWGTGIGALTSLRLWTQDNFGEDLIFGPIGGAIYYWDATLTVSTRGKKLASLGGNVSVTIASPAVVTLTKTLTRGTQVQFASTGTLPTGISASTTYQLTNVNGLQAELLDLSGNVVNTSGSYTGQMYISDLVDVPIVQNGVLVSDASRFIFALGANDYGSAVQNPMLIRWSDQENPYVWTPDETNQAGSILLSHGSRITTAIQTRQEIVVFTDTALYSVQFVGAPAYWGSQLLGDNISIIGPKAVALASGVTYWMGKDKFYLYDGRLQTLNSDLRRYVFEDINQRQSEQVFCTTNEGFNEVWWFYCSANSDTVNRYVVYNYVEKIWYYGTMARTAWLDSSIFTYPIAATYQNLLMYQENGTDANETGTPVPIEASISSAEFDIDDGHNFGFIWRVLPDVTFGGSSPSASPQITVTLYGLRNSGSGVNFTASDPVVKGTNFVITEEFTGQINTRIRARQLIFKVASDSLGTAWQCGAMRIDIRSDGRR